MAFGGQRRSLAELCVSKASEFRKSPQRCKAYTWAYFNSPVLSVQLPVMTKAENGFVSATQFSHILQRAKRKERERKTRAVKKV